MFTPYNGRYGFSQAQQGYSEGNALEFFLAFLSALEKSRSLSRASDNILFFFNHKKSCLLAKEFGLYRGTCVYSCVYRNSQTLPGKQFMYVPDRSENCVNFYEGSDCQTWSKKNAVFVKLSTMNFIMEAILIYLFKLFTQYYF